MSTQEVVRPDQMEQTRGISSPVQLVYDALTAGKYDWRTPAGIAKDAGLSEDEVVKILQTALLKTVVRTYDSDYPKTYFYTTRDRQQDSRPLACPSFGRL